MCSLPSITTAESWSWRQVERFAERRYPATHSLRIPLQFPGFDRLVYCDPSLNAYVLPVLPDLSTGNEESARAIREVPVMVVAFALEEAPVLADFRCTEMSREGGVLPMVTLRVFLHDVLYNFTYCCSPQGHIHIGVRVENTYWEEQGATLRCGVFFAKGREVFNYHYVEHFWESESLSASEPASFKDGFFVHADRRIGRVHPGHFAVSWDEQVRVAADRFNRQFSCARPHFAPPSRRLEQIRGMVALRTSLKPGESQEADLVFSTDLYGNQPLADMPHALACRRTREAWEALERGSTMVDFGDQDENNAFQVLRTTSLQYVLELDSLRHGRISMPCQGSSSERFFVWVWEAMCMLKPYLSLGCFTPVRRVLEFILTLQDGGCPPEGDFTTLAGAIGTTGPRWSNSTGAALTLAGEYLRLSADRDFFARHADGLVRAGKWILGEVRATRKADVPEHFRGLMPRACATDGDVGYVHVVTDNWSCLGVRILGEVLNAFGHPAAAEITVGAEQYRADILRTLALLQRANGFIPRTLSSEGRYAPKFNSLVTPIKYIASGLLDASSDVLRSFVTYCETHVIRYPFFAPMDIEIAYVGNNEDAFQRFYLQNREWKKAWLAFRSFYLYAKTADLHLTQERFSRLNRAFAPWQPNSSNNGRLMEAMIRRIYHELPGTAKIQLLCGLSPGELSDRQCVSVRGLHTTYGKLSLTRTAASLVLSCDRDLPQGLEMHLPPTLQLQPHCSLAALGDNAWALRHPCRLLQLSLEE